MTVGSATLICDYGGVISTYKQTFFFLKVTLSWFYRAEKRKVRPYWPVFDADENNLSCDKKSVGKLTLSF